MKLDLKKHSKAVLFIVAIFLAGLSFMPLFDDPYHQETDKVNFWTWLIREIDELIFGEIDPATGERM